LNDAGKARLPDVAEVEAGALEAMQENPELAVKHPGLLRSIKSAYDHAEISAIRGYIGSSLGA
jgi:hypothetical protein